MSAILDRAAIQKLPAAKQAPTVRAGPRLSAQESFTMVLISASSRVTRLPSNCCSSIAKMIAVPLV
jgi:hypothetical protein